jgi:phthiodiolone/phenolphthiodiolone dimycocerosates ketoreductase
MGEDWHGIQDLEPQFPSRDRLIQFFDEVDVDSILASVPHGTPKEVAQDVVALHDAGARAVSILDYSGMAGQEFAARSTEKVRETEDEILRLLGGAP